MDQADPFGKVLPVRSVRNKTVWLETSYTQNRRGPKEITVYSGISILFRKINIQAFKRVE